MQAFTKFSQSKPLYDALSALDEKWKAEQGDKKKEDDFLTRQQKRAVENSLRSMKLGGVGLEGAEKVRRPVLPEQICRDHCVLCLQTERMLTIYPLSTSNHDATYNQERFNEIKVRLAELSTSFSNHVLDATKQFSLTVDDPSKMDGVPDSAKQMWAQSHMQYMKSQAKDAEDVPAMDSEKGPWRLTLDMPSYIAAMSHVPDRAIREKIYMAQVQKASEIDAEKNNVPLIYEILSLRAEMAKMLGYSNYAELSLAKKMAPSIEAVTELSDLIALKAVPAAKRELDEITALAREKGGEEYSALEKLEPWDVTFWSERLKESKFDMTEEELRPYFALPAVLDGMFGLLNRLFDIQVKAADGEAEIWNDDVRFFKIFDNTGKHIASFFLDPYSRPENKRGGAWMDTCIGKSEAVNRDIPVAYLTCNGSPPVGDKPSLMTFREVETLFHETGHGLQHMLTKATIGDVAGINGTF